MDILLFDYSWDEMTLSTAAANRHFAPAADDTWMNVEQVSIHGMMNDGRKPKCWEKNPVWLPLCLSPWAVRVIQCQSWACSKDMLLELRHSGTDRGERLASCLSHLVSGERTPKYPRSEGAHWAMKPIFFFLGGEVILGPAGNETPTSFSTWSCHYTK